MSRILVVDDHPLVRRNVRGTLEEEGYQVCGEAGTGREAVKLAGILKPDLVVLDLSMPEMNGLEAARQILRKAPGVRVLILTMHEEETISREALATGASACVMKSDIQRLIAEVRRLLGPNRHHSPTWHSQEGLQLQLPIADDTVATPNPSRTDRERKVDGRSSQILRVA